MTQLHYPTQEPVPNPVTRPNVAPVFKRDTGRADKPSDWTIVLGCLLTSSVASNVILLVAWLTELDNNLGPLK